MERGGGGEGGQKVGNRYKQLRKLEDIKMKSIFFIGNGDKKIRKWGMGTDNEGN